MNNSATWMSDISSRSYGYTSKQGNNPTIETYRRIVLALTLTSIVFCLIVLQICVQTLFTKSGRVLREGDSPVACVECKKLQISDDPFEHDPLLSSLEPVTDDPHGVVRCCAFNEPQLSALFEMSMRQKAVSTAPLPAFNVSDFTLSPASAHRRLYPPKNPAQKVKYQLRVPIFVPGNVGLLFQLEGSPPDPLVEHARGVDVLKDGLRIQQRGLYYVYSSINFRPESGHPCKKFAYQTLKHFVNVRHNEDIERTLLSSVHTCCDDCTLDETTRFTGGVFRLDVNDTIRVAISGHGLASFQKQTSFAGVTMLGLSVSSDNYR